MYGFLTGIKSVQYKLNQSVIVCGSLIYKLVDTSMRVLLWPHLRAFRNMLYPVFKTTSLTWRLKSLLWRIFYQGFIWFIIKYQMDLFSLYFVITILIVIIYFVHILVSFMYKLFVHIVKYLFINFYFVFLILICLANGWYKFAKQFYVNWLILSF